MNVPQWFLNMPNIVFGPTLVFTASIYAVIAVIVRIIRHEASTVEQDGQ